MKLEPPNLNLPLYGRNWTPLRLVLLAGAVGWLWHRPTNMPDAAVSVVAGGAAVWLVFCSAPSVYLLLHHSRIVRAIWFVAALAGLIWFQRTVMPYLHALV